MFEEACTTKTGYSSAKKRLRNVMNKSKALFYQELVAAVDEVDGDASRVHADSH